MNLALVAVALLGLAADRLLVEEAKASINVACDTWLAYDKSGDAYCVTVPNKSQQIALR